MATARRAHFRSVRRSRSAGAESGCRGRRHRLQGVGFVPVGSAEMALQLLRPRSPRITDRGNRQPAGAARNRSCAGGRPSWRPRCRDRGRGNNDLGSLCTPLHRAAHWRRPCGNARRGAHHFRSRAAPLAASTSWLRPERFFMARSTRLRDPQTLVPRSSRLQRACSAVSGTRRRGARSAVRLKLPEGIREEAPAHGLRSRFALDRRAAVDAAYEPVEHAQCGRTSQAEAARQRSAERAHDPAVLVHAGRARIAPASVAARRSAHLHVATVPQCPLPCLSLWMTATIAKRTHFPV